MTDEKTLWVPVERLQPIVARHKGTKECLSFAVRRRLHAIEHAEQKYVRLDVVDAILYALDLDIWLRYRKEDGGLADIYMDGAQYGTPNRNARPERRKYESPAERDRIRAEKVEIQCQFCGSKRRIRRDSLTRGLRSRCRSCRHEARPTKRWTREAVIEAMHAWAREHERPPRWTDWMAATPTNPPSETARRLFGGWNKAIEAAGFQPRPVGYQRKLAA